MHNSSLNYLTKLKLCRESYATRKLKFTQQKPELLLHPNKHFYKISCGVQQWILDRLAFINYRDSPSQIICKIAFLRNYTKLTRIRQYQSLILRKLEATSLKLKFERDSLTQTFFCREFTYFKIQQVCWFTKVFLQLFSQKFNL